MKKLNGFNNGRDTTDGVGGRNKPFFSKENKKKNEQEDIPDEIREELEQEFGELIPEEELRKDSNIDWVKGMDNDFDEEENE